MRMIEAIQISCILLTMLFFIVPSTANAEASMSDTIRGQVDAGATVAELQEADPRVVAARFIKFILSLVGTIFLVLILMSGFWWLTAQGEEEKITKAKNIMRRAIIGIIIIMMAYSITYFVGLSIEQAVLTK